jgi:hypothetical protein
LPESKHRTRRGRRVGRGSRSNDSLSLTRPRRRRTNPWYLAASVTIAILVIGGFALGSVNLGGGSGRAPTGDSDQFEEGVGVAQPVMANVYPNPHVPEGETVSYSTTPPTSGKHWDRWAQCGIYEDGLDDERIAHNLEHGNIIVSYNLTASEDLSRLRNVLEDTEFFSAWGLARFYDKIPEGQVALTTWGVMDTMEEIDADRIQRFFSTYAGTLGPEQVDCRAAPFQMDQ